MKCVTASNLIQIALIQKTKIFKYLAVRNKDKRQCEYSEKAVKGHQTTSFLKHGIFSTQRRNSILRTGQRFPFSGQKFPFSRNKTSIFFKSSIQINILISSVLRCFLNSFNEVTANLREQASINPLPTKKTQITG